MTRAIPAGGRKQYLDRLPVERARGITVKAQGVSLLHRDEREESESFGQTFLLNLVDTPGHADFSFEVSRSLAACDGALLLVDATQGVQAQTIATFYLALEAGLEIVPAANKVDMDNADVDGVKEQMLSAFGIDPDDVLPISAKTGMGCADVLSAVVDAVPPPRGGAGLAERNDDASRLADADADRSDAPLRALLLDCHYDPYRGAVSVVQIEDGTIRVGDSVAGMAQGGRGSEVLELGMMTPEPLKMPELRAGHVGYVITGSRDVKSAIVGDTLYKPSDETIAKGGGGSGKKIAPLPGFRAAKPTVFQGLFPQSGDEFEALRAAVERLVLNDASVSVSNETSVALGPGFRCGFLGLLHADVFHQRLREEFDADVVATAPTVSYRVRYPDTPETSFEDVASPAALDEKRLHQSGGRGGAKGVIEEPMVDATIICPADAVGKVVELCVDRRGSQLEHAQLGVDRVMLRYRLPSAEIAVDFSDELKSRTSGYATFDYDDAGYEPADIVRLDILVNGEAVDALSSLTHRDKAVRRGRDMCARLKEALPRQLFEVAVQAAVSGKVVARETVSAMRKNVTAKCYGGDISRKKKLLSRQKEGKKRMKRIGNVDIPNEAFAGLLSTQSAQRRK
uniref:Translation factor GUF1 homolog, mitochondrial n=1 Tax=Micromonas pusilla TaxID=38833 RepID=A0A7R9TLM4_MICPS